MQATRAPGGMDDARQEEQTNRPDQLLAVASDRRWRSRSDHQPRAVRRGAGVCVLAVELVELAVLAVLVELVVLVALGA